MRALFFLGLVVACRGEVVLEESECVQVSEQLNSWCMSDVRCLDSGTGEEAFFSRIRKMPDYSAVDTSVVGMSKDACQQFNVTLPSIHTDLQNWCAFHAGLYGTKGLVPLGARVNSTFSKGWSWEDGGAADYDRLQWGQRTAESIEGWCVRVDASLKWTPWPCDTSAYHNQKDYIACGPKITPGPTHSPTESPTKRNVSKSGPIPEPVVKTQKSTETKESGAYVYWAAPALATVLIAAFLIHKRIKESKNPVENFNYKLQNDVEPPSITFSPHEYQYDGNLSQQEDPEYALATGDNVSLASEDNEGYLKPKISNENGEIEVTEGDYDLAVDVAPENDENEENEENEENGEIEVTEGNYDMAINVSVENNDGEEFGLDFSELDAEVGSESEENGEAIYSVAGNNEHSEEDDDDFGI